MGEALLELEQVLRSKQVKLTPQEQLVLLESKSKAVRQFLFSSLGASTITWVASKQLSSLQRLNLSGGAAAVFGLWGVGRSLDSSVDHVLSVEGSQMQRELANIIVRKFRDDPWKMELVSRHFYLEKVFDDSTLDQPKLRWRHRNSYTDNVYHSQWVQATNSGNDSNAKSHSDAPSDTHSDYRGDLQGKLYSDSYGGSRNEPNGRKSNKEFKKFPVNTHVDEMSDPLDCIFGHTTREEIHHPDNSTTSPRTLTRSQRRAQRKHRRHRQEVSSESESV